MDRPAAEAIEAQTVVACHDERHDAPTIVGNERPPIGDWDQITGRVLWLAATVDAHLDELVATRSSATGMPVQIYHHDYQASPPKLGLWRPDMKGELVRSSSSTRLKLAAIAVTALTVFAAACGDDDDDDAGSATAATEAAGAATTGADATTPRATEPPADTADADGTDTTAATQEPATTAGDAAEAEAMLADLYAAAQEEGSVTIYSSQGLDQLTAAAEAFEAKYPGVDVEVVRGTDADAIPRIETELSTNTAGGDLVVTASPDFMITHGEAGDWVDPTASPELAGLGSYDAEQYVHDGNFFEVGAAVLTFAWNTDDVPDGLADYADLLAPELAGGRIAVIDPAISPAAVDYYLWLEETFGEEYVEQLAAQEPRIYPSALPIGEALTSGEVSAAAYAAPGTIIPAAAAGAPVDFGISESGAWAARFFGAIPKSSDSPNAAALLADFLVTPEGQALVQSGGGSVQPDVPGTLITNDMVRVMDLEATAPEPAAAYVEKWNALFR